MASSSHLKPPLACGDQPFKWTTDPGRLVTSRKRGCQKIETGHQLLSAGNPLNIGSRIANSPSWGSCKFGIIPCPEVGRKSYRFRSLENLLRWSKRRKISMCSGRMR